ncbi:MAG: hypothetical protein AB7N65_25290 [Vicinamibacterales bacterium]
MSPILVRPVREQLEHDRIIRLLQAKCRRKFEVGMNPGSEQNAPVANGAAPLYPDLVLQSLERGHRLQAVIEVETGESVNHLEALAEWAHFAKLRAAFHLYVPSNMVEVARRLCEDNQIQVHEFWSYHFFGDEARFTLVHRSKEPIPAARSEAKATPAATRTARTVPARDQGSARPVTTARTAAAGRASSPRRKTAQPSRPSRTAKPAARKTAKKPARAQKRK